MDSYIQMFTIAQNGDINDSSEDNEGISVPRRFAPIGNNQTPIADTSSADDSVPLCRKYRTPDKRWCPKRRRMARTSRPSENEWLRLPEDCDTETKAADPRKLQFDEFKTSVEDAEASMVAAISLPTNRRNSLYLEKLLRTKALLDKMTPQKVKHRRSKKRKCTTL